MNDPGRRAALPATVWVLGLVSLFMDISSEMIHALMPVFVVGTLGAGAIWLGLSEGVAEVRRHRQCVLRRAADRGAAQVTRVTGPHGRVSKRCFHLQVRYVFLAVRRRIRRGSGERRALADGLLHDTRHRERLLSATIALTVGPLGPRWPRL